MKKALYLGLLFCLAAPAAAQTELKCPDLKGKVRLVKVSRMEPARRGKEWLDGLPKSAVATVCDIYGMKTEESEYDGKSLLLKSVFEYKEKDDARAICAKLAADRKSGAEPDPDQGPALADFCADNGKNDFGAAFIYDASPSQGRETARKPVRKVLRLYNKRGFVTEERTLDPQDNLESVTLRAYDKANNLSELTVNDPEGRTLRRETYTADKATSSRARSVYGANTMLQEKTVYELREDGTLRREVRTTYDSGEQPVSRAEFYCDEKGRREKELDYDADAAEAKYEFTYSYKYDKAGNWTEERRTRALVYNGNLIPDTQYAPEITRRDIQYY
jgi:hypothetical protein